ncbi:MAG TPA: ATP-dependent Clp protease adaptor ClpS [Candidatus Binatia bacterium]|nr:ATP-dependent Clp protease adaptor ClpS [Candidatus Binatia bacterium]
MSTERGSSDPIVSTKSKSQEKTRTRRVPPYHVILENDDFHTLEFVVDVLCKALGYTKERSVQLTLLAHHTGRAVVWTGTKEVAELKVEQIRTFHEIRAADQTSLGPLRCTIEPAPGA